MRVIDILREANENVFVIGDSIAKGIAAAGGLSQEYVNPGKNTSFILQNLVSPFAKSGKAKGAIVILSSGAANSGNVELEDGKKFQNENLGPVSQQIKMLKDAGATVMLVGVGPGKTPPQKPTIYTQSKTWTVDYTGMNDKLQSIASSSGATFLGPLDKFDPMIAKGDGIHPGGNAYKAIFQAAVSSAPRTTGSSNNPPAGAAKIYAIGDSHANAIAKAGKFENLATDGRSAFSQDNDSAIEKVAEGSTVVLSVGANDMMGQDKRRVSGRINDLINKLKQKKAKVYYVLFAETDNPKFTKDRNQLRQTVKANLPSGIEVIDMGALSVKNGDGIHAPMSWYSGAANTVKSGDKPAEAPTSSTPTADKPTGSFVVEVPQGNRNPEVADVQKALVALGFPLPKHGVDGIRGPETSGAIRDFQRANKLPDTGTPDQATVDQLNAQLQSKPDVLAKLVKSSEKDVKPGSGTAVTMAGLKQDAVTKGKVGKVLDFIAKYESGGNYEIVYPSKNINGLADATIETIYQFQKAMVDKNKISDAVGRYQYTNIKTGTLPEVVKQMGLDPKTTVFDEKTQDEICIFDLKRRCGLDQWLSGQMSDEQFLDRLARVWAAFPDPQTGQSKYAKNGIDKAGLTVKTALNTLSNIKASS